MISIKIINETGVGNQTKVINYDGSELRGVKEIEIFPIKIDELVVAKLTFIGVELDIASMIIRGKNEFKKFRRCEPVRRFRKQQRTKAGTTR